MNPIHDYARWGRFLPEERCFELTAEPPKRWFNVHYNQPGDHEVYAETSNLGDGPVTIRDQAGNRCELVPYDAKYLYIRDDETNRVFNPWGAPCAEETVHRSCRYYPEKTVIAGECLGLRVTQRIFIPADLPAEIWTVHLENRSERLRTVSLFAYSGFALHGQSADGRPVRAENTSTVHPEFHGVFVRNHASQPPPTSRYNGYILTTGDWHNGNGHRLHFLRSDLSAGVPRMLWGFNCDGRGGGYANDCCGIVQVRLTLAPGETTRRDFVIGQAASIEEACSVRDRLDPGSIDARCAEQAAREAARADAFRVKTGYPLYDALLNDFTKKQMVSYLMNKSGVRDNLQIDAALCMADYEMACENACQVLGSQYASGAMPHSFRPINRLQYADKPAWALLTIPALIKESGDFSLLERPLGFLDSNERTPVWDHLCRALRFLCGDTGGHGLCDQHFADWNDGLEPSDLTGARESVMVTQQLACGLLEMETLARRIGDDETASFAREQYEAFKRRLNEVAWDGAWYLRTLCENGPPLGTHASDQARIFLNTQSWAVLSRTAEGERARTCMRSVDALLETDIGYAIVHPPCHRFDERIGRFSGMLPGHATNGGAYCHAAGFKAVADCMLGRAEEAWRTFQKVAPGSPWNPPERSKTEPFAWTNCYEAIPQIYGESVYAWRTGTAAWFTMALVEWMFGIRRDYDGLRVDPCLSVQLPQVELWRHFRGADYHVMIDNHAGRRTGTRSITVDGQALEGNRLPVFADGQRHEVHVVI